MVKRWLRGIGLAVFSLVFLAGCSGPLGTAIAGIVGAGSMYGGQAFLSRVQEDVEAKVEWRIRKADYVREYTSGLLQQARALRDKADFKGWREAMDLLIKFHDTQHPETLVMELKRRARENRDVRSESILQP